MPHATVPFEEFMKQLRAEIPEQIRRENEDVEGELPDLLEVKPKARERSLLIKPDEARKQLRGLMQQREKTDRFLDVVSAVRGEKMEITGVHRGHRDDGRDYILKGRNETGVNVDDLRVLLGVPEREGEDIRNEVSQSAFYRELNLSAYRARADFGSMPQAIEDRKPVRRRRKVK